jgi:hypothetical protein
MLIYSSRECPKCTVMYNAPFPYELAMIKRCKISWTCVLGRAIERERERERAREKNTVFDRTPRLALIVDPRGAAGRISEQEDERVVIYEFTETNMIHTMHVCISRYASTTWTCMYVCMCM